MYFCVLDNKVIFVNFAERDDGFILKNFTGVNNSVDNERENGESIYNK